MNPLTSALIAMRRSPILSLTAIMIISLTLFVGYTFSFMMLGTQQVLKYFESRPQVIGFFELNTSQTEINQIKKQFEQKSYVTKVSVITQEQALVSYQKENKDDPLLLELVTADVLPASIEVSADKIASLAQIKQDLDTTNSVEEVIFQQDIIDSLSSWTNSVRYLGIGLEIVLSITSFLIITALISMKVATKKVSLKIMPMLGASKWFIISPLFFEGVLYGFIGSILGWMGMFVLLLYLTPWLTNFLGNITLLPVSIEIYALQLCIGTLVAITLGGLAAISAVRRIIK